MAVVVVLKAVLPPLSLRHASHVLSVLSVLECVDVAQDFWSRWIAVHVPDLWLALHVHLLLLLM